jgi:hypothetical protein
MGVGPRATLLCDFNRDGHLDIATANDGGTGTSGNTAGPFAPDGLTIRMGNGDGTFGPESNYAPAGAAPVNLAGGDLNGDGAPDIVVATINSSVLSVLLNNGDGTFGSSYALAAGDSDVAIVDWNHDGRLDIVASSYWSSTAVISLGNGDGTFAPPRSFHVGVNPFGITVADFNDDGVLDLATSDQTGNTVTVLLFDSGGNVSRTLTLSASSFPHGIAAADFNRDGKVDLVVANSGSDDVSVFVGLGNGDFAGAQTYAIGSSPRRLAVGDINGDGIPDVVVANTGSSDVSILIGFGDGSFAPVESIPAGTTVYGVSVSDLDGDGMLDVVTCNRTSRDISVLLRQPLITASDASLSEADSGSQAMTVVVSLSHTSNRPVTVNYATADGSAIAPGDYTASSGTLTFSPGTTIQSIALNISDDALDEDDESFTLSLSSAVNGAIAKPQAICTITDNDPEPSVSINDVSVAEGDSGSVPVTFNVTLSPPSGKTVTVGYSTADATATAGEDYAPTRGTLTFPPGTVTQSVSTTINSDTRPEADERFFVNLMSPSNASIARGQGVGTIVNDDGMPTISIGNYAHAEGNRGTTPFAFTITLSNPSTQVVTVQYYTSNQTAIAGKDYTAVPPTTVTFNPGEGLSKTVTVWVNGDTNREADETFLVNLYNPVNATIATLYGYPVRGSGTILNDD